MSLQSDLWATRLVQLADLLGRPLPRRHLADAHAASRAVLDLIDRGDPTHVWVAMSILTGQLPTDDDVLRVIQASGRGASRTMSEFIARRTNGHEIVIPEPGTVLLDVATTLAGRFTSGIPRVVRETTVRWTKGRWTKGGAMPVAWASDWRNMRPLTSAEATAIDEARPLRADEESGDEPAISIIPWRCVLVTAEVFEQFPRAHRMRALARFSQSRTAAVVHDCSPITLYETRPNARVDPFVSYLSGLARFTQLVADSVATQEEFQGWMQALAATGIEGPPVDALLLPFDIASADAESIAEMRRLLQHDESPVVTVVGSRQPRKNHLAVLQAAELAWRRGHRFRLVFVGTLSWGSDAFGDEVDRLLTRGRPIDIVSDLTDSQLAAVYELSRFTLFPSLSEGFGLPVAESLALGTPVITSDFGSVREIADAGGGALLVDPRDDHAIAEAIELLLSDDSLLERLRSEARSRDTRTWEKYCDEAWPLLVGLGD